MEFEIGKIVRHKLTGKKLIILSSEGLGNYAGPPTLRVRKEDYEVFRVEKTELEENVETGVPSEKNIKREDFDNN